ncbi:hypothetical protein J7T55_009780 [Diaporthe amygdali]|uniref:uncharacterized protein n=1 Tax=Phomopsis amygdali TaxID=1214568 RepID=UPI0022FDD299|nr:uncharacterized protein J7T55_009780 [Diaporthe amygdali]KAJ0116630.1 hypothetical protein J7T55_009780 [Diaporthe amygdali]
MSQPSDTLTQVDSITTTRRNGAEVSIFEALIPAVTSNSEPEFPARQRWRFLPKAFSGTRPISKTDIPSSHHQLQNGQPQSFSRLKLHSVNSPSVKSDGKESRIRSTTTASKSKLRLPQALKSDKHDVENTQRITDSGLGDYDALPRGLQNTLYREINRYSWASNSKGFITPRKLVKLLDIPTLEKELKKYDSFLSKGPQKLQYLRFDFTESKNSPETKERRRNAIVATAERIYGNIEDQMPSNASAKPEKMFPLRHKGRFDRSYVKILAILILIERPARIKLFVEEGICDADLPLVKKPIEGGFEELRRSTTPNDRLRCFERWDSLSLVRFEEFQWRLLAPSFEHGSGKIILHQTFDSNVILPFTYFSESPKTGGFGEVTKVRIHPDHHNFNNDCNLAEKRMQDGSASQQSSESRILLYGRHGDIKPENILWFPATRMSRSKDQGILKLADFGVADFSTKNEFEVDFNRRRHQFLAQSPTYRSPENDFEDPRIGSSYDIWSLGCVYLEFIAWWFGRWKLVKKFADERTDDDQFWTKHAGLNKVLKVDTFFEIKQNQGPGGSEAFAKPSVSKWSKRTCWWFTSLSEKVIYQEERVPRIL